MMQLRLSNTSFRQTHVWVFISGTRNLHLKRISCLSCKNSSSPHARVTRSIFGSTREWKEIIKFLNLLNSFSFYFHLTWMITYNKFKKRFPIWNWSQSLHVTWTSKTKAHRCVCVCACWNRFRDYIETGSRCV
jgi:hypothetical protein